MRSGRLNGYRVYHRRSIGQREIERENKNPPAVEPGGGYFQALYFPLATGAEIQIAG